MSEATPQQTNGDAMSTSPPETPGAFPTTNGVHNDKNDEAPRPQAQRTPTAQSNKPAEPPVDAEACKAAGNKFFKAKQYDKAVEQYTKGNDLRIDLHRVFANDIISHSY